MALEVSAAIIGILAAAGKVAETLGPLVSAYVNAPKHAQRILTEVKHTRTSLLGLQKLFEELGALPQRRKELIPIDQLVVALTDGVLLFSELEARVKRLKAPEDTFSNRLRWAKKVQDLDGCVLRLLSFKTSMSLMLGILQCESDLVARQDRTELRSNTAELLRNDRALADRLAILEYSFHTNRLIVTDGPASLAPTELTAQDQDSAQIEEFPRRMSITQGDTARTVPFERVLKTSRVYRKVNRNSERFSFHSSVAPSHAWSALSDISLSDISAISVLALPLSLAEITNARHYAIDEEHLSASDDQSVDNLTIHGSQWPGNLPSDTAHSKPLPYPWIHPSYFRERSQLNSPLPEVGSAKSQKALNLVIEGATGADVHGFMGLYAEAHDASLFIDFDDPDSMSVRSYVKVCRVLDPVLKHEVPVTLDIQAVSTDPTPPVELSEDHFTAGDMYMFVYSTSFRSSFDHIRNHPRLVYHYKGKENFPVMIIAKRDNSTRAEEVTHKEGMDLAAENHCNFQELSETNARTVNNAFRELITDRWDYDTKEEIARQKAHALAQAQAVRSRRRGATGISKPPKLGTEPSLEAITED